MIDAKVVDHSHADAVVAAADHTMDKATGIFKRALEFSGMGDLAFAVAPYVRPGFNLARACKKTMDAAAASGQKPEFLILLKHGLFTWGVDHRSSYEMHIKVVSAVEKYIDSLQSRLPKLSPRAYAEPTVGFANKVQVILRGLYEKHAGGEGTGCGWIVQVGSLAISLPLALVPSFLLSFCLRLSTSLSVFARLLFAALFHL